MQLPPYIILPSLNKTFENIQKRRLVDFWNKYNVFASTKLGFRKIYSTTLAIAHLCDYVLNEFDKNNNICAIFMDLAKAIDSVNHEILLCYKLEQYVIKRYC